VCVVTFETVRELVLALPETSERASYDGTPSFRVKDKFLARLRPEGGVLVLRMNIEQKEVVIASWPEKFFSTPHYDGWPGVLIRFEAVSREEMEDLLLEAWLFVAPPRVRQRFEAGGYGPPA